MISEAVSARLPVVGVAPRAHRFTDEEQSYREFLIAKRLVPRAADRRSLRPTLSPTRLSEIEPIKENPLDALAAKLKAAPAAIVRR